MQRSNPNWIAASCGLLYILAFLFLPIYSAIAGIGSLIGITLVPLAPILLILLFFGIAMILSALLLPPVISMCVGGASAIAALVFCFLGKNVIGQQNLVGSVLRWGADLVGSIVPVFSAGLGLYACMIIAIAFIVIELVMGNQKTRKIKPNIDDFGSFNNGPIDF